MSKVFRYKDHTKTGKLLSLRKGSFNFIGVDEMQINRNSRRQISEQMHTGLKVLALSHLLSNKFDENTVHLSVQQKEILNETFGMDYLEKREYLKKLETKFYSFKIN